MRIIDTFLNPNGRISRARFWLSYIGLAIIALGIAWGAMALQQRTGKSNVPISTLILLIVPLVWINLCLMKRWHDRNRSGPWLLINLIPGIGQMWTLIECGFIAGTPGGNKYGCLDDETWRACLELRQRYSRRHGRPQRRGFRHAGTYLTR